MVLPWPKDFLSNWLELIFNNGICSKLPSVPPPPSHLYRVWLFLFCFLFFMCYLFSSLLMWLLLCSPSLVMVHSYAFIDMRCHLLWGLSFVSTPEVLTKKVMLEFFFFSCIWCVLYTYTLCRLQANNV